MSPIAHIPFQQAGSHPYVTYRTGYVPTAAGHQFWIECACSVCGPMSGFLKQCMQPPRAQEWVWRFAVDHSHGLRPVRR